MSNIPPQDFDDPRQKLQAMLAGIWERSKATVAERIETLREAQVLAAKNGLDEPARLRAVDAAHKLAGVLGTFGLPRGTELAREAEEIFERGIAQNRPVIDRLDSLLIELESLVNAAEPPPRGAPS
jgi:HPt (histidine-containing phosphotransfer) domain-containing protein